MANHEPLHFAERKMRSIKEHFPRLDEYIEYAKRQGDLGFPDIPGLKDSFPQEELLPYAEDYLVCIKTIENAELGDPSDNPRKDDRIEAILRGEYVILPYMVNAYRLWGDCKHIYRFDATLAEELCEQPLDDSLPKELFDYLPYGIFFIDCSSFAKSKGAEFNTMGLWIFRSTVPSDSECRAEDSLCMVIVDDKGRVQCESLHLGRPTISQIVGEIIDSRKAVLSRVDLPDGFIEEKLLDERKTRAWITQVLNLILYVCSVNADIQQAYKPSPTPRKANPKKRNRRSESFIYDVGFRVGPALGAARAHRASAVGSGAGPAKTPHVRRAHWHHYWKGPRNGERRLVLKWLSPINVNMDLGTPVTILHEASQR